MVSNRMTDGVGKRIVDALKQQDSIEIRPAETSYSNNETYEQVSYDNNVNNVDNYTESSFDNSFDDIEISDNRTFEDKPQIEYQQFTDYNTPAKNFTTETDDFEMPANVAVLRQLINKLPSGVSKQTGAQIIKQTMEALGISMKSVLQEAQQVQDNLNNSVRECQSSIVEHKKQINELEKQTQKLQRQYSALNDIISLFIQTNL